MGTYQPLPVEKFFFQKTLDENAKQKNTKKVLFMGKS